MTEFGAWYSISSLQVYHISVVSAVGECIEQNFYLIDFIIGFGTPTLLAVFYVSGRLPAFIWRMFWAGTAIGLMWEIPLSTLDGLGIVDIFSFLSPPPHFAAIIASHSFWDGGLFVAGIFIVTRLVPGPHFTRFRAHELALLMAWGQIQELCVELVSTGSGGWSYNPSWWNPELFTFSGRPITLLPQIIWLAAPALFYVAALKIRKGT